MTTLTHKNHKMQLNGNLLTGETFAEKEYIKAYMGGKWDADYKGWRGDVEKVNDLISKKCIAVIEYNQPEAHNHNNNGLCPKCHTYCYGDCSAK